MSKLATVMKFGNNKLPTQTAIFNMGSATHCPSKKLGLCQAYVEDRCVCYALSAEKQYPNVLPYRNRQARYWASVSAKGFVRDFMAIIDRRRTFTRALRLNESGDFRSQKDITKAEQIAELLSEHGIKVYMYTARRDLDFSRIKYLVINASGNWSKRGIKGQFRMLQKGEALPKGSGLCPMDCTICRRCLFGKKSCVKVHR